jgi:uncharacterized protein
MNNKLNLLFVVLLCISVIIGCNTQESINESKNNVFEEQNNDNNQIPTVCAKDACFNVELAKTGAEQSKGLMNRENMAQDVGMLFVFNDVGTYSFWMKNTLISLDMIWVDENYKIVDIYENAKPCGNEKCLPIIPIKKSKYVLEINGGLSKINNIKIDDLLEFKNIK